MHEPRYVNPIGYVGRTRSASFPTDGHNVLAQFVWLLISLAWTRANLVAQLPVFPPPGVALMLILLLKP